MHINIVFPEPQPWSLGEVSVTFLFRSISYLDFLIWVRVVAGSVPIFLSRRSPFDRPNFLTLRFLNARNCLYCYTCVYTVVDAINKHLTVDFPIHDVEKLKQLELDFRAKSTRGVWAGQVGAVDGVHFAMRR